MSNLENKKIARDCTISALFFTLAILACATTAGAFALDAGAFALDDVCEISTICAAVAMLFCFLVLILSSVALRKWRLNARDNISCKTKKYLTAIVVLLFITFVFLLIAMIFGYFGYDRYYFDSYSSFICGTICITFSFATMVLNIVEIVLFSIAISLEKKAMPQKLSAETATKSLQDYKYLYENGLITQEEYDTQRERILSQLGL